MVDILADAYDRGKGCANADYWEIDDAISGLKFWYRDEVVDDRVLVSFYRGYVDAASESMTRLHKDAGEAREEMRRMMRERDKAQSAQRWMLMFSLVASGAVIWKFW
jgi:hypothetical protein